MSQNGYGPQEEGLLRCLRQSSGHPQLSADRSIGSTNPRRPGELSLHLPLAFSPCFRKVQPPSGTALLPLRHTGKAAYPCSVDCSSLHRPRLFEVVFPGGPYGRTRSPDTPPRVDRHRERSQVRLPMTGHQAKPACGSPPAGGCTLTMTPRTPENPTGSAQSTLPVQPSHAAPPVAPDQRQQQCPPATPSLSPESDHQC